MIRRKDKEETPETIMLRVLNLLLGSNLEPHRARLREIKMAILAYGAQMRRPQYKTPKSHRDRAVVQTIAALDQAKEKRG